MSGAVWIGGASETGPVSGVLGADVAPGASSRPAQRGEVSRLDASRMVSVAGSQPSSANAYASNLSCSARALLALARAGVPLAASFARPRPRCLLGRGRLVRQLLRWDVEDLCELVAADPHGRQIVDRAAQGEVGCRQFVDCRFTTGERGPSADTIKVSSRQRRSRRRSATWRRATEAGAGRRVVALLPSVAGLAAAGVTMAVLEVVMCGVSLLGDSCGDGRRPGHAWMIGPACGAG